MNLEEIKKRLMKMKALANAGVGGERANAERLLAELAAKHGINLDDLDGKEIEEFEVKFTQAWQKKLLGQLAAIIRQEKRKRGEVLRDKECELWRSRFGSKYCKFEKFTVYATKCDWLELTARFEVLKADYKRQCKDFYLAFLVSNNLLTDPDDDAPPPTREELEAYSEALRLSCGIKPSRLNKQLENKESICD